jgi:hypothetical protein
VRGLGVGDLRVLLVDHRAGALQQAGGGLRALAHGHPGALREPGGPQAVAARVQVEHPFQVLTPLPQRSVPERDPHPDQVGHDPDAAGGVPARGAPVQGGAHVRQLRVHRVEPRHLLRAAPLLRGPGDVPLAPGAVPLPHRVLLARRRQRLGAHLPDRFQHPEPRWARAVVAGQQGVPDEPVQQWRDVLRLHPDAARHRRGRLRRDPAGEHRQPLPHQPLRR